MPRQPCSLEHGGMAHVLAGGSRSYLSGLSPELLMIIFEQLLGIDPKAALNARRVCRRFNDIATPLVYRTISLTKKLASEEAKTQHPQALRNISQYTKHLIITSDLNGYWVQRILARTEKLRQITWRYSLIREAKEFAIDDQELAIDLVSKKRLKVHIEGMPLCFFGHPQTLLFIASIPPDLLVSLKFVIPVRTPSTEQSQQLKELLVQADNLETLHYRDQGQGTHFTFGGTERLPAFKELRLEAYDWTHDSREVEKHWDFSRLESLSLVSMPTYPFLNSVSFPDLANLQTLQVEDFSLHYSYRREEATKLLHTLVRDHIRAPTTLDLRVHTALFPLDAITTHANSLQVLRLRDHTGFGDENIRCPTLSVKDLTVLAHSMTCLHTLELDMDTHLVSTGPFLRAICAFPALRTLTLHVHTLVDTLDPALDIPGRNIRYRDRDRDRDRDSAHGVFQLLVQVRHSAATSWRSVAINVGGWQKKTMVRRLGQAWKKLNRQGVFAERCFTLRVDEDGNYVPSEEDGGGLSMGSPEEERDRDMDASDGVNLDVAYHTGVDRLALLGCWLSRHGLDSLSRF